MESTSSQTEVEPQGSRFAARPGYLPSIPTAAESGDGVASQRSRGRDDSSLTPYYRDNWTTIYHGDCREILPHIGKVGLICTDPPYGVGISYSSYEDKAEATADLIVDFLRIAEPLAGVIALTAGNWQTELRLYQQKPPKWRMCWYKGAQSTASPIGFNDWEVVMIYGDKVHRNAHDYFFAQPELMGRFGHPCPKPIQFCAHLINRLARPGEIVCDPFAGSGTTLRAAKDTGHKAIGIELDERYCEIAAKRLEQEVLNFTPSVADTQPTLDAYPRGSSNTTAQADNASNSATPARP